MKHMTIAICDDRAADARLLDVYLKKCYADAEVCVFHESDSLMGRLMKDRNYFDLIFLEICMKNENGIEIAKKIRVHNPVVPIIFVSECEAYYREAFDVFAAQYLLKPLSFERLADALKPLAHLWEEREEKILTFRYRSQILTLRHSQVCYISSSLHTVNFHMSDGRIDHCRGKLDEFGKQLENSTFLRCHQSFFVNLDYVVGMKNNIFILADAEIPISRSHLKNAQEAFLKHLGNSRD